MALLLSCVRAVLGTRLDDERILAGRAAPDWQRLITMALGHGVMPLLHAGILGHVLGAVPGAARDEVRSHFNDNTRHNLFRAGELVRLLALFDTSGIRAVPLKGPVLAMSVYGSVAMRQFTDLDLLISRRHVDRAAELLRSRGYEVRSSAQTSLTAVRADEPCSAVVDLQWTLAEDRYSFPLTVSDFSSGLTRVPFMNGMVWQPALEDQLLILCAHPAKHCWSRLEWVSDVTAFVLTNRDRIDWRAALERADRFGARRLLLLGVQLAADLLRVRVPADVVGAMHADRVVGGLASELSANLTAGTDGLTRLNGSYGLVEAGLLYIRTRERLADKLPYIRFLARLAREWWTLTPNERDRAVVALPLVLEPLYFAVRPIRLLQKYGRRLVRCGLQACGSVR
jgi:hypothetical protein